MLFPDFYTHNPKYFRIVPSYNPLAADDNIFFTLAKPLSKDAAEPDKEVRVTSTRVTLESEVTLE